MALKFFLTYISIFLALSVTLTVVVSKFVSGFAANGKKPYLYGIVSSAVASGAAYVSTLISDSLFLVFWFLAGIYLLFGIIHLALVHRKYFYSDKGDKTAVILGEIMFGLSIISFSIVVFFTLQFFIEKEGSFLFYPVLMSTLAFFIPFLFLQTFEAAYAIPPALFKTWQYPVHQPIELPGEDPKEKLLVIGFEIRKKAGDGKKTYFRAKAPEGMKLGELYYHFINDYNELHSETTIEYTDDGHDPHQWWFRRKPKWYQSQRILNPDLSVRENKIKENTVIVCERIDHLTQDERL